MRESYAIAFALTMLAASAVAETCPQPGDIYREFALHNGGDKDWRVTDDQAVIKFERAQAFLPNPKLPLTITDLEHAVRAEVLLDRWGGHRGTINKRIRFNEHDWLIVPEISAVPAGIRPAHLMFQDNPVVAVPLSHLQAGTNTFEADCDEQNGFGWGQWGVYSVVVRVYYDQKKKNESLEFHTHITSPTPGTQLAEHPTVTVQATSAHGVARVDVLAAYDGYDEDGDGIYSGWHKSRFQLVRGQSNELRDHVGTAWRQPYQLTWNTHWIPDQQPNGIQFVARVQDSRGYWTVTESVKNLSLIRQGNSVKLYRAIDVPEDFGVRVDQELGCWFQIPAGHDLSKAEAAALHLRTWHGDDRQHEPLQINGHPLPIGGKNHHYDYDLMPFPTTSLRSGRNDFTIHSKSEHHQLEVLWPGPALVVRYAGRDPQHAGTP